ncbi:response regulator [candidate division KSB1 bacterium]
MKPQQKRVLVVDDVEELRKTAIYSLSMIYPHVGFIEAANGFTAIDKMIKFKPDLVLLDIEMPEMNGIQFLRRIRNSKDKMINSIPVIMFTGVVDKEKIDEILQLGVHDYLVKPYELESLYKKVDKFLKPEE